MAANPRRVPLLALLLAVGLGVLLVVADQVGTPEDTTAASSSSAPSPPPAAPGAPNVVVIQTDDQSLSETSARTMPSTFRLLAGRGSVFRNYIVTTPDCCPSRASLFTGDYAHNHGVLANRIGYPGLVEPGNVLPVWLRNAGYTTVHLGKFMNGYERAVPPGSQPAPGWDHWFTYVGPDRYYGYQASNDGVIESFGERPRDYVGRVLDHEAVRAIGRYMPRSAPLYLQVDARAPHASHSDPRLRCYPAAVPDPRDYRLINRVRVPHRPSYNEARISDKPPFIKRLPRLTLQERRAVDLHYACAVASLRSVDRTVAHTYRAVRQAGELHNTVFVFTSDNGLLLGEHRLTDVKQYPYEEAIRVPLIIRMPGRRTPPVVTNPTANIDLAPTLLQLAQAVPCVPSAGCRTIDGRSLVPLLTGVGSFPANRHLAVEFSQHKKTSGRGTTCSFTGVWTPRGLFAVHYRTVVDPRLGLCENSHVTEHYDLATDPAELHNLTRAPDRHERARIRRLSALVRRLRDCAGSGLATDDLFLGRPLCE